MRDWLFGFADLLDLVFLNPTKFPGEWNDLGENEKSSGRWIALLSGLSIAVGVSLVSPPYNKGIFVSIFLATVANFILFLMLPVFLGSLLDYFAQKKERKGQAKMMVAFVATSLSVHLLFVPLAFFFVTLGITGLGGGFLILLILFLSYGLIVSRGVKYIYDLKNQDAMRLTFTALLLGFFFPFVFNFYMTANILNLTL